MDEGLLHIFNRVEKKHWWWKGRQELLKNFITPQNSSKILDIGSGTGETVTFLKSFNPKADFYGIDNSQVAVDYSKKHFKKIYKANAEKLPFKNNYFDTILLLDVLEHIKDQAQVLLEAKRVLKPKGQIILTSPALSFIWSKHDTQQHHYRRYTRSELRQLAKTTKLNLNFISYFNFFLSPPIILIRLLSRFKPLSFLADFDSNLNYDISDHSLMNQILTGIFTFEVKLLKYIHYPLGISIVAVFKKNDPSKNP